MHAQADRPEIIPGRGAFLNSPRDAAENRLDRLSQGPLSVRYLDAEAAAVIDDIVGEVLGLDYTIAADVQGRISLRMTEVSSREAVLQQLQSALAAINVAMIDRGDFIAFVRGGAPGGSGGVVVIRPGDPVAPGVGVAAIQLNEATPTLITPLLTALVSEVQVRLADDPRGLLILAGEAEALSAASEAAHLLDVRYLDQVSTGVFPLAHAEPGVLAGELRQLLRASPEVIEYVPIERLNLLVVFSNNNAMLDRASAWVRRLDQAQARTAGAGRRVYYALHADPAELVEAVQALAGAEGAGGAAGVAGADPGRERGETGLLGGVRIGAAPNRNLILLQGEEAQLDAVVEMLELLDIPRPQVSIEAAIVEITLTDETRFGIDWNAVEDDRLIFGFSADGEAGADRRFPGFSAVYIHTDLDAALNALASQSELEVISRPSLLTLHNEEAELQVGDQVPVVVQSAVSVTDPNAPIVNQTAYRNTGVLLNVRPQVRAGGLVEILVSQEVSGVVQTTSSGIDSPTITQRRVASTLLVPSGETVALGGLISTRRSEGETGVPVLRRVPVLGRAFRSETFSEDRTELVVLITPTVVTDATALSTDTLALPEALERLRLRSLQD
ncbi:MAG: secretin N-terminal domain-containing protein [Oceanicaulis sp.]